MPSKSPLHLNRAHLKKSKEVSVSALFAKLKKGDVGALSQSITLVESQRPDQKESANELIRNALPLSGNSIRIGFTGIPGAGKSSLIEALGSLFLKEGHRLAILAVDPSSQLTKGSILGDKTRMETLSGHPDVFIRPSPSGGNLGGVARASRESIILCEAAGYDIIFVETVGVGQSEISVHSMVDLFLLIAIPGAGDELQGIKRGIMEMADLILINKSEGENKDRARAAARHLENALHLFPKQKYGHDVSVMLVSALEKTGLNEAVEKINALIAELKSNNGFDQRRKDQSMFWLREEIDMGLKNLFYSDPRVTEMFRIMEQRVEEGSISSFEAAQELVSLFKPVSR